MGRIEQGTWGIIGAIIGTLIVYVINSKFSIIGAIIGAIIGYYLGKEAG